MKVRNPQSVSHRVHGVSFPAGAVVDCPEEVARFVIEHMGFEKVQEPKPIAEGAPVTKPATGKKK